MALYGPWILELGRRWGLDSNTADDLLQMVSVKVWRGIHGYDPAKGRFRSWLRTCIRNEFVRLMTKRRPESDTKERPVPAPTVEPWNTVHGDMDSFIRRIFEEGFDNERLARAVVQVRSQVKPTTWKAFLMFELLEMRAKEIAPLLNMKPGTVHRAAYVVRCRLRDIVVSGNSRSDDD